MSEKLKPEIFKQTTPCADCPFRKVGGARHGVSAALSYMMYFLTMPGVTFPCHKSVPKSDDRSTWSEWKDGQVLCAGGMIFALKQGAANLVMRLGVARGWFDPFRFSNDDYACVFDRTDDMLAAQTETGGDDDGISDRVRVVSEGSG